MLNYFFGVERMACGSCLAVGFLDQGRRSTGQLQRRRHDESTFLLLVFVFLVLQRPRVHRVQRSRAVVRGDLPSSQHPKNTTQPIKLCSIHVPFFTLRTPPQLTTHHTHHRTINPSRIHGPKDSPDCHRCGPRPPAMGAGVALAQPMAPGHPCRGHSARRGALPSGDAGLQWR